MLNNIVGNLEQCCPHNHSSHNLRKFPQIYAVSMGVVLVIMRMHSFQKFIVASFLTTQPLQKYGYGN